jgi:hypothetical protein
MSGIPDELIVGLPSLTLTAKAAPALWLVVPVSAILIALAWRIIVVGMGRSLRHLTKIRLTPSQTEKVIGRFKDMDDRTCAIVMGAMLDQSLEAIFLLHMKPLSNDERDRLFFGYLPLGSFSAKIKIAAAFGIIGPKTLKDLEALNEIRSVFGHATQEITFRNRAIRDRLNKMHVQEAIGVFFRAFRNKAPRMLGSGRGIYFVSAWPTSKR